MVWPKIIIQEIMAREPHVEVTFIYGIDNTM